MITTSDEDFVLGEMTTTDQTVLLQKIEYNTRLASIGVSHLFSLGLFLLGALAVWIILKRWFFSSV